MASRRARVILAVALATLASACSVETPFDEAAPDRSSQIDRVRVNATVLPNGVVQVRETVFFATDDGGTIALGGSTLGAGLLDIPITLPPGIELPPGITLPAFPNAPSLPGQRSVTNVTLDGAPVETTTTTFGGQELRISRRDAVVAYDLSGAVERFPDIAVLDLPVLPSPDDAARQDPDVDVTGTVSFAVPLAPETVDAHVFGGRDRTTAVADGQLRFSSRAPVWAPGNALYVGFPATLVPETTEFSNLYATQFRENAAARGQASDETEQVLDSVDETNRIGRLIFIAVAIALPTLFFLRVIIHYLAVKVSQRREVGDVPDELSQPPTSDDPAVVGVLWAEGKPDEPAVAGTMLALAHRRAISIEEYGERVVVRVPLVETGESETEAAVLSGLRANASPDGVIEGPPVWRSFPGWKDYRRAAVLAAVRAGYASRAVRIVDISGLLVTTGIGLALVSGIDLFVIMPMLTIAAVVLSFFVTVVAGYGLTKKGRRARALWKAFGEYIEHHAEFRDVGPAGVAIWGPYLVYGAVIGEARHAARPLTP